MSERVGSRFDDVLNKNGAAQLDFLEANFSADALLGAEGLRGGMIDSLRPGPVGQQAEGMGVFTPGLDSPINIDPVSLVLSEKGDSDPIARKIPMESSPVVTHIVVDTPRRFDSLTGNYKARGIASFAVAAVTHAAKNAGSSISMYFNNGERAGLIHDGDPGQTHASINEMEGKSKIFVLEEAETSLNGLLKVVQRRVDTEHDAVFVVSDFLEGFDKESETFAWESSLQQMEGELKDRLASLRITSPSQKVLPPKTTGLISIETSDASRKGFENMASIKNNRINNQLDYQRSMTVDTYRELNPEHPVRMMARFILGSEQ